MDPYTHQIIKQPHNRKKLFVILISFVVVLVLAVAAVFALQFINHQKLINEVKTELSKVPSIMDNSKKNGGYPSTISSTLLPDSLRVSLVGQGSFDGVSYCVTGTSKIDKSVVYHIDSSSTGVATVGSCTDAADLPQPAIPSGLAIASVGTDQIDATWAPALYASSYVLECSTNADFSAPVIDKTYKDASGACQGLKSSTQYFVRIKSGNSSKGSKWSGSIKATTKEMSVAPTDFNGSRISTSSVGYSWNAVDGAKSYVVELSQNIDFIKDVQSQTVPSSKLSAVFAGLQPNTAYFIHVKAVTSDFNASSAAFSNEIQVRTLVK